LLFVKRDSLSTNIDFDCDWIVLDLQDSVPGDEKHLARQTIANYLTQRATQSVKPILLRINELSESVELEKDLATCLHPAVYALLLPMINNEHDIQIYEKLITNYEKKQNLNLHYKFICLIETPAAILNLDKICRSSQRIIALSFGHADFLHHTLGEKSYDSLIFAKSKIVLAARAYNLEAIDSPFTDLNNSIELQKEAELAKRLGFSGKFVIHPKHLYIINNVFSVNPSELEFAKKILEMNQAGCFIADNAMLGPPFLKKMQKNLEKNMQIAQSTKEFDGVMGRLPKYGLDLEKVHPDEILYAPYELTITEAWLVMWQALSFSANLLETNIDFCKKLSLKGIPLPYTLLLSLSLCMCVEILTENCVAHLSINNAVYHEFTYPGDTLHCKIVINNIKSTSKNDYTIIESTHVLYNQENIAVFSTEKSTLYKHTSTQQNTPPLSQLTIKNNISSYFKDKITIPSLKEIHSQLVNPITFIKLHFYKNDLIIHNDTKTLFNSENSLFNSLLHNTHPIHSNHLRHKNYDLTLCGLHILPIVFGITNRDLKQTLSQEITYCTHLNKVNPHNTISAISYVHDTIGQGPLEEILITTIAFKDIDSLILAKLKFPIALFSLEKKKNDFYEKLCADYIPILNNRIILICHRKLMRLVDSTTP